MKTAEWECTRCGATNRRLVPDDQTSLVDHCVSCHTAHRIEKDARPVRWRARGA